MLTKPELLQLLVAPESSRVEKTASTTDKDKFGEAVCAFANDMADTGKPGYLLVGVRDDGSLSGLKATDALLQKFASIRFDGYVNRYNRGIATLQRELAANGNGPARFSSRLLTAFEAVVSLSKHVDPDAPPDLAVKPAVSTAKTNHKIAVKTADIAVKEKTVAAEKTVEAALKRTHPAFRAKTLQHCTKTYFYLKANSASSSVETAKALGISPRSVANYYKALQKAGLLVRVGPAKGGSWEFSA